MKEDTNRTCIFLKVIALQLFAHSWCLSVNCFLSNRLGLIKPDIQNVNCSNWRDIGVGTIPNPVEPVMMDTDYTQKVK